MMNSITITAVAATVAACISLGSPASAQEVDDGASSGRAASTASPYATPLEALGGRTLAQYLADHQARRTACCTW